MQTFLCRILFVLALCLSPAAHADEAALLAKLDPELMQKVRAGDPSAAYEAGAALIITWEEPYLRAALPLFETAFSGANAQKDGLWLASVSALMIGRVHVGLLEFRKGLAFSEQAEAIARSMKDNAANMVIAGAMEDQAKALIGLSRYRDALVILDQLLAYYQSDPVDDAAAAAINWTKGIAHEGLSEFDEAIAAYGAAMTFYGKAEQPDNQSLAGLGNNLGWVLHRSGKYADAKEWFALTLPIYLEELGPFAENTAKNYVNLGLSTFELGDPDAAIKLAMKAMPYVANNRTQSLDTQRWLFELLAKAFAAKGEPKRAIFFGKMAVNAQQAIRAANSTGKAGDTAELQAEWRRLYQLLADLLITEGRISEAQAVLNMEKEEEVFNYLKRDAQADITKTRATLNDAELDEEEKLQILAAMPIAADAELRALSAKIEKGEASEAEQDQIFTLQDALQAASDQFDTAVDGFLAEVGVDNQKVLEKQFDATGSYQSTLGRLPRPTAILQIATLPEALHLFVTLPGVTLHREIRISRADLARLVFDTLQSIEDVAPDAPEKLHALQQVVFAPIEQALLDAGVEVVMLNLDGFLRYVPFAALRDDDGYLIEHFAFVQFTPAIETQFDKPDRTDAQTAGFGVTEGHPGFSPLPGVKRELDTIFGTAGGQAVLHGTTELDGAFDERSLKVSLLKSPEILHIASHFNLMPGQEDDSFLLLGDGEHLPLSKIRKTRALSFKGVDLLTLSACQTARGSDGDGAEIDGFGITAQLNGASSVMASLWPVSDAATPRLMRDFYAGIMQGGLDKAEALRQAQLKMLHSADDTEPSRVQTATDRAAIALDAPETPAKAGLEHPYFWSAFVLMGNWL
ncbi:CHAT domain-containing protein [Pseudorhodobacter sp.]|uniref:CHAT domain-containing protein n=1 Tax=Pseudorhodobacter sp. TaxID=1934400 RepID=UPI002649B825|nr:CHAT domain-containing protein [Pseudorhodobacter sp.]MDN5788717.1 CHAT domain-containing protein [Pseudorhodobacter sp.]